MELISNILFCVKGGGLDGRGVNELEPNNLGPRVSVELNLRRMFLDFYTTNLI